MAALIARAVYAVAGAFPVLIACANGGYVAAYYSHRIPQKVLRISVVVIGLAMATWFFSGYFERNGMGITDQWSGVSE